LPPSRKDFRFNAFTGANEPANNIRQLAKLSFGSDRIVTDLAALAQLERQSLLEADLDCNAVEFFAHRHRYARGRLVAINLKGKASDAGFSTIRGGVGLPGAQIASLVSSKSSKNPPNGLLG
jgi:hypothetical protein